MKCLKDLKNILEHSMSCTLEIPSIDFVKELPAWGRAWMYAKINDHHDASLEINCEPKETGQHIIYSGIELRTLSGQEGYSLRTWRAIADIACQSKPDFPEIEIGQTLWRPAERRNGIIRVERKMPDSIMLTLVNTKKQCSVLLSTQERDPERHSIQVDQETFQRFLALWGAMQRDWMEDVWPASKFRGMSLDDALTEGRDFLL